MIQKDKEHFNRLMKGGESFLLTKKYDDAYKNYKAAINILETDLVKSKIEKLENYFKLREKLNTKKAEFDYNKAMQLALKLVLNGTYGAFANKYFVLSNSKIANSITAMGRNVIQYMLEQIEEYFYFNWHNDTKLHDLLGLEYLAQDKESKYYFLDRNYDIIDGPFTEFDTNNINNDILKSRNIPLSRLTKITKYKKGDYDILFEYNICSIDDIKPIDENPTWNIIDEKRRTNPDEIFRSYTGSNPVLIYGDTDSLYLSFEPIMNSIGYDGNEIEFILHLDKLFVKPFFKKLLNEYAGSYNVDNIHDFELETINKSAIHFKKKHYINDVVWEDGIFYDSLSYFYPKGIEIIRSSTPSFVRGKNQQGGIWDFIRYLFYNSENLDIRNILKMVKEQRKEFELSDIESISMNTSCTNYENKVMDDINSIETVKGAHFSIKAAALHNYTLNKHSEYKTKYDLIKSGKIKYYYCNNSMNNIYAYLRSFHPYEITEKENILIDYDTQFSKTYLTIVNKFIESLGLPLINKRLSVLNSLFSFK